MRPLCNWERPLWLPHENVADDRQSPCIYVLAGTNGAGKSSLAGAMFSQQCVDYFNPDDAARRILAANPRITQQDANSAAWHQGKRLLERAIAERLNFALETTLGGNTITTLLQTALSSGIEVRIWYVGLGSPELHIARVRSRVSRGGHDIPESTIRSRYHQSRLNLIRLMPHLTELLIYDNSKDADPALGTMPEPMLILHLNRGKVEASCDLTSAPEWSKPILMAAMKGR
jgi:predicted ABC-type ATPase